MNSWILKTFTTELTATNSNSKVLSRFMVGGLTWSSILSKIYFKFTLKLWLHLKLLLASPSNKETSAYLAQTLHHHSEQVLFGGWISVQGANIYINICRKRCRPEADIATCRIQRLISTWEILTTLKVMNTRIMAAVHPKPKIQAPTTTMLAGRRQIPQGVWTNDKNVQCENTVLTLTLRSFYQQQVPQLLTSPSHIKR